MTTDTTTYQLQFWDAKARSYVPSGETCDARRPDDFADHARDLANGRAWRVCRPDRELSGPGKRFLTFGRSSASDRSAAKVCSQYLEWARDHGLQSITFWSGKTVPAIKEPEFGWRGRPGVCIKAGEYFTGTIKLVDAAAYFAVEHTDIVADAVAELEQVAA